MFRIMITAALLATCTSLMAQVYTDVSHLLPATATGGNTMDAAVADLNGDGLPDLVLAKEWQRNRLLFNNGAGGFTDVTEDRFSAAAHDSEDIAIADLDGNGWPDIVFAAEDDTTHELYLNTGNGNFTDVSDRLPHFVSNAVLAADINGDQYPDLLFGNHGQSRILINDGLGNFTDETVARMPVLQRITQDLLLVDVDHDGDADLVMGNEDGNCLLINNGSGVFSDETATRLTIAAVVETRKVSSADVNGDGHTDLFFSNMASGPGRDVQDRLLLNDGSGHFTDASDDLLPPDAKHTFDAVFSDFNTDGKPDLLVAYMGMQAPAVFINRGNGLFADSSAQYLPASAGNTITIIRADLDNDGVPDIFLGRFQQPDALLKAEATLSVAAQSTAGSGLQVFPVPGSKQIKVQVADPCLQQQASLTISDMQGRILFTQAICNKTFTLTLPMLGAGAYLLSVHTPKCRAAERFLLEG